MLVKYHQSLQRNQKYKVATVYIDEFIPWKTVPKRSASFKGISSIMYIHPTTALPDVTSPNPKSTSIIRYMLFPIMSKVYRIVFARHIRMKKLLLPNLSAYFGSQYMQHHPMKKHEAMKPTFQTG